MNREHAARVLDFQEVRTVPLAAVLERLGILSELKKIGAQHVGCCPIHRGSNNKQFVCHLQKNVWKCFSPDCAGKGGSTIELVSALEGIDARGAAQLIATWFAIGARQTDVQQRKRRRRVVSESANQPTHRVYSSKKREGAEKDDLTPIGSGWVFNTKDGRGGLNIILSAMPIGDRIVVFERDPQWEAEQQAKKEGAPNGGKFTKKK